MALLVRAGSPRSSEEHCKVSDLKFAFHLNVE